MSYTLLRQSFVLEDSSCDFYVIIGSELWFEGRVIAKFLGYSNEKKALQVNVDPDYKRQFSEFSINESNINFNVVFVKEIGIYQLILKSKLPRAKILKEWIISKVIPTIKQRGQHRLLENLEQSKEIAIRKIENEKQVANKRTKAAEQEMQVAIKRTKFVEGELQIAIRKMEAAEQEKQTAIERAKFAEEEKQEAIRKIEAFEQERQMFVDRIEAFEQERQMFGDRIESKKVVRKAEEEKQIAIRRTEVVERENEEMRLKNENLITQLREEQQRNRENRNLFENTLFVLASTLIATRNNTIDHS
jgi:prophage antirepressor-like protein